MSIHRKLTTVCCAAVLAFGLAACGSSDDDDSADAPTTTEPTGPTQAELDAEKMRADEAEQDLADKAKAEQHAKQRSLFAGLLKTAGDPPVATFDATPEISASHGKTAKITAPATDDGMDAAFADLGVSTALDALDGWSGTDMLAKNLAGITDHLNVYTDIDIASETTFAKLFPNTGDTEDHYDEANRVVQVPDDGDGGLNDHQGLVESDMAGAFQTGSGTRTHGDRLRAIETITVPGTFAGATGVYECAKTAANACTTSGTNAGTSFSSNWQFNVDGGQMASVPDDDFSHFGWWLRIATTGAYDADVFHGSTLAGIDTAPTGPALTGSATYLGKAAGKAAIHPQLPGADPDGGAFTADAMLRANFQASMINGMIDNFMIDGESRDWTVTLGGTPTVFAADTGDDFVGNGFDSADTTGARDTSGAIWSIGGAASRSNGVWSGDFHGPSPTDGVPMSVTGEFTATYNSTVGRMEGAFGANRQ